MTMKVLQDRNQILSARKELISKKASFIESKLGSYLRKLRLTKKIALGDQIKSWDVLQTLNFIEQHIEKVEPILDIGSYASETIVALHRLGFTNLTGADLNSDLAKMPYKDAIHYEITNFMHTPFAEASFKAVTAISVIEHGFNSKALLMEISRLLQPHGYFIASFDYWPEKINTTGIRFFGMDWEIFSKEDITALVKEAEYYGLFPTGKLLYAAKDRPIEHANKKYTFAWLVLQKED